jgi:hypothetical protein
MKSKTFALNSARFSAKPIAYYDNSKKGGFDIALIVSVGGNSIKVSCPLKDGKAPFTEDQFKKGPISFVDASFHSYDKDNRPVFQVKSGSPRNILLDTDIGINQAVVGGIVSLVNEKTNRFIISVNHMNNKTREILVRKVLVSCDSGMELPKQNTEVVVCGEISVEVSGDNTKMVGIKAQKITVL